MANWKVRPETLKQANRICVDEDLTQYELAELALSAYIRRPEQSPRPLRLADLRNQVKDAAQGR